MAQQIPDRMTLPGEQLLELRKITAELERVRLVLAELVRLVANQSDVRSGA